MGQSARGGAAGEPCARAHEAAPPESHARGIGSDLQQPGFGLEVRATGLPRRLNGFEGRQKSVLGEVLAFLPIAGQAIDYLEHQSAIVVNERLDRLGRRQGIDTHGVALPL